MEKKKVEPRKEEVELETQLIMRMPVEPARVLREAIQSGANNLKDRLTIRLDNDLRYGEVRFDHWLLHVKVVDLPTIVESLKTIDNKNFYKTADLCQIMICKEEPDLPSAEEESPNKNKKKDPNKVDKKYLWPHGITPPCKNVRKRRFRKTLKKKYVEAPEIEKEVKRLLRVDNEAVNVKWDLITEDEDPNKTGGDDKKDFNAPNKSPSKGSKKSAANKDVGEHDIFGEEVSDSDEDDNPINKSIDIDESSRLSAEAEDSRLSDSSSFQGTQSSDRHGATEFKKGMFSGGAGEGSSGRSRSKMESGSVSKYGDNSRLDSDNEESSEFMASSRDTVSSRLYELRRQLSDLKTQRIQKEQEIRTIENQTLRQRLQDNLDSVMSQIVEKEMEIQELEMMQ
ncbi:transcription initiation factor TFIID subunit 7 [Culex quinquefasciatus]|uniref:Transcription initiation factor TFIID subunit 7 n=1 Tax=Culex quinquefasciatus TaxID=7176 RepID=B0WP10_CULQU|nr:transcription initiation factor TFIID subunit 7 [Culex quinquefasciatus]XP_039434393.1 transcription initiation factor TFIID subunit 7 [Culex pipiens pallens]EDS32037.1 transcription initiation factor TFIID subunit 7 [Culex quinquefasciatus]|eukprot:XP_001850444.1 transcription initiation factor TFIID subunit 7 [Culex quinquefasciatus]